MSASQRFEEYLEHSGDGLGHMDRHKGRPAQGADDASVAQ